MRRKSGLQFETEERQSLRVKGKYKLLSLVKALMHGVEGILCPIYTQVQVLTCMNEMLDILPKIFVIAISLITCIKDRVKYCGKIRYQGPHAKNKSLMS